MVAKKSNAKACRFYGHEVNCIRRYFCIRAPKRDALLATVKSEPFKHNFRYILGNPDCMRKRVWSTAHDSSWCGQMKYLFQVPSTGAWYEWRRTHNNNLGAKRLGKKSFKLVDASGGVEKVLADSNPLAEYIWTHARVAGLLCGDGGGAGDGEFACPVGYSECHQTKEWWVSIGKRKKAVELLTAPGYQLYDIQFNSYRAMWTAVLMHEVLFHE